MRTLLAAAARNNADWCDAFCRAHGIDGSFSGDVWAAPARTPPLYPDAVTFAPGVRAGDVLRRVETGSGCSVKDSFADLDLGAHGFGVLFEAEWIHHVHPRPASTEWRAEVLFADPAIRFLRTTGGSAIANRSADVIGLTNLVGTATWSDAAAAAQAELGAVPVVGYASGADLVAAHLAGFESDGPLRVWVYR